jgi:hypothetical protein
MFPSSTLERETPTLLGPLGSGNVNHWATYVVFSSYLEFRTVDTVHKSSDSELCSQFNMLASCEYLYPTSVA